MNFLNGCLRRTGKVGPRDWFTISESEVNMSEEKKNLTGAAIGGAVGTGAGVAGTGAAVSAAGTVAGLSGAGISSGVAAIGGGSMLLGGAALLTGVGALALLGGWVGYKIAKKL